MSFNLYEPNDLQCTINSVVNSINHLPDNYNKLNGCDDDIDSIKNKMIMSSI